MYHEKIKQYVKEYLLAGYTLDVIKYDLIKRGYCDNAIDIAIIDLYNKTQKELVGFLKFHLKKGHEIKKLKSYLTTIGHNEKEIEDAVEHIKSELKEKKKHKSSVYKLKRELLFFYHKVVEAQNSAQQRFENFFVNQVNKILNVGLWLSKRWSKMKYWHKGGMTAALILTIISLVTEIFMISETIINQGRISCYSFGAPVICNLGESIIFYAVMLLVFFVFLVLPAYGVGALVTYLILRKNK